MKNNTNKKENTMNTMKITKQSLFNEFKTCDDSKSKISFLTKMKNLKLSTKLLNHLDINFDNLIKFYTKN
jgi:hypothetical protein